MDSPYRIASGGNAVIAFVLPRGQARQLGEYDFTIPKEPGMPIPKRNADGLLPVGIHDCTFAELEAEFGQDRWMEDLQSDTRREVLCSQRSKICSRLRDYLAQLGRVSFAVAEIVVNGSFVTAKPDPNDIDLIVVVSAKHDFSHDLPPIEYNLLSGRGLRAAGYPFDVPIVAEGGTAHEKAVELFQ